MTRHFRPVGFVDTPVGHDGQVARLAGGLQWFSSWEVREGASRALIPVGALEPRDEAEAATIARVSTARPSFPLGARTLRFHEPQIVGILNVTPDSFSDGGRHDGEAGAIAAGLAMGEAGAAIVDIGGESTRPGARPVWEGDEIARVEPVVRAVAASGALVSVDTRKASVMQAALEAGAAIVNDVSALLFDRQALALMGSRSEPIIIMHWPDAARTLHAGAAYGDVLRDVYDWLECRIIDLETAGIARSRLIVDPGIGFGKSVADNLALMNGLALFHGLGCPVLVGASRKRFIGAVAGEEVADRRLAGSLAMALKAAEQGVQLIRVHDVAETGQALRLWRGLRDQGLSGV